MAITFLWHRGTRAALATAINDLDARLAAVEALTAPGVRVTATAVSGSASIPSHWVQDAIRAVAVTGSASVPSVAPRSAAALTATAVLGTASVGASTPSGGGLVASTSVDGAATVPSPTVTVV